MIDFQKVAMVDMLYINSNNWDCSQQFKFICPLMVMYLEKQFSLKCCQFLLSSTRSISIISTKVGQQNIVYIIK